MKYRPEIDGLRALAILPIILFHAGFDLFSGGFVGVDIFFVISGYLITSILVDDIKNNRFSIINFYERRARRILPALFFIMLVCIPFSWLWMLPSQMMDFSKSLIAASLFISNILFWHENGYFAAASEEKPLLHTWSLAIEEQYYLIFPIFLILVWRFGKNRVFWIIVFLAAISLLLSEWGWRNSTFANFYLAPTRAWELLFGSIASFIVQNKGVQKNNLFGCIGLLAILCSIFTYDKSTPSPSIYSLLPVTGVLLIILYTTKDSIIGKLLSLKFIVGVGLISYSAYLYHQPLFAYCRLKYCNQSGQGLMLALIFVTFLLAYFSWKYIEKPFRSNLFLSTKTIFLASFISIFIFIFFGSIGYFKNGLEYRFERNHLSGFITNEKFFSEINKNFLPCEQEYIARSNKQIKGSINCFQTKKGEPDWILLGDSHAEHLFPGLASNSKKNVIFYGGNQPYLNEEKFIDVYDYIATIKNRKIIFVTMHYFSRVGSITEFEISFNDLVKYLIDLGHIVILVGDVPIFKKNAEFCIYGSIEQLNKYCTITQNEWSEQKSHYEQILIKIASHYKNSYYTNIGELFCDEIYCKMINGKNQIMFRDNNHLNLIGSEMAGRFLASFVKDIQSDYRE